MNLTQVRWHNGEIREYSDFFDAWQTFHEDKNAWKISWFSPNGKRMRVIKEQHMQTMKIYSACYVEDIMDNYDLHKKEWEEYNQRERNIREVIDYGD
jgi:hypothetical protein